MIGLEMGFLRGRSQHPCGFHSARTHVNATPCPCLPLPALPCFALPTPGLSRDTTVQKKRLTRLLMYQPAKEENVLSLERAIAELGMAEQRLGPCKKRAGPQLSCIDSPFPDPAHWFHGTQRLECSMRGSIALRIEQFSR